MSDEKPPPGDGGTSSASPAAEAAPEPTELQVLGGGVEITVTKIDQSSEAVKVRQLPWRDLPSFGSLQGDEAALAEFLCGKQRTGVTERLRNAHITEYRLTELIRQAEFEQIPAIEKELNRVRTEIEELEKNEHWSDSLTEESLVAILDLGMRLNEKRFGRWAERRKKHTGRMMKTATASVSAKSPPA